MSNRISGPEGKAVEGSSARGVERVRATTTAKSSSRAADSQADTVHITDTARAVLALQEAVAGVPDVDTARVEQLRLSIDSKTYQVDAGKIADKLLSLESDLQAASQTRKY